MLEPPDAQPPVDLGEPSFLLKQSDGLFRLKIHR